MKETKDIVSLTRYYAVQAFHQTGEIISNGSIKKIGLWDNVRLDGKIVGACDVASARVKALEWKTSQPGVTINTRIKRINLRKVPMSTIKPIDKDDNISLYDIC